MGQRLLVWHAGLHFLGLFLGSVALSGHRDFGKVFWV